MQDALSVLRTLGDSAVAEDLHVRRILVHRGSFLDSLRRRRQDRPRLDLETREGILVRWGTFNAGELPEEVRSDEKIAMLQKLMARDLSTARGICLDVRTRVPGFRLPGE